MYKKEQRNVKIEISQRGLSFFIKTLDIDRMLVYYIINTLIQDGGEDVEFNSNLPIYVQIIDYIKNKIIVEEFKFGDKLPSVRELSTDLKVNPNTILRSYQELERKGLVFTQRGMGTFVTEDIEVLKELKNSKASNLVNEFINDMYALGLTDEDIIKSINKKIKE